MAIRRRTGAYWEKRSIERLAEAERESLPHLRRIVRIYEEAARKTVRSVRDMYAVYYREQGWDLNELNSIAPSGDIKRFLADMRSAGLETELPDNYRGRMTRLELLNAQIWGEVKKVAQRHTAIETAAHTETIKNSYYRTIYDTAKGFGATPEFSLLNTRTIDRILNNKFQGKNYSQRIWKNTDLLASQLKDVLGAAIATGQSPEKTVREIRQRFQVGSFQARRLVQTETNFFENAAEIEAYEEMGIGSFVFVATLDGRTSQICREHDGKRYPVSKSKPGVNMPPLHPWCRSTIRPYIGKDYEPEVRIARDTNGRNVYVSNMSYKEWSQLFVHDISAMVGAANVVSTSGGRITTTYGAVYDTNKIWGVDSELIEDTVRRAEYLLNEYPEVQRWVKDQGGLIIRAGDLQRGTIAATYTLKPIIVLSRAYYIRREHLLKIVERGDKKGHFMPMQDRVGYAFNHEFGHVIQNYLLHGRKTVSAARKVHSDIIEIARREYGLSDDEIIARTSLYAQRDPYEFFAELFANLHSGKPNKLGRAMGDYLKRVMK